MADVTQTPSVSILMVHFGYDPHQVSNLSFRPNMTLIWNKLTQCVCDVGYEGDGINCIDTDECSNNPTLCDHGQCLNQPGSFVCECDHGFMNRDSEKRSCMGKLK